MITARWDWKDESEDGFQLVKQEAAGWTLFWIFVIALVLTNFGWLFK